MTQRDPLFDKIQQTLEDLRRINEVHHQITVTMSNPQSRQEEFDHVIKTGIDLLNEIEHKKQQG